MQMQSVHRCKSMVSNSVKLKTKLTLLYTSLGITKIQFKRTICILKMTIVLYDIREFASRKNKNMHTIIFKICLIIVKLTKSITIIVNISYCYSMSFYRPELVNVLIFHD